MTSSIPHHAHPSPQHPSPGSSLTPASLTTLIPHHAHPSPHSSLTPASLTTLIPATQGQSPVLGVPGLPVPASPLPALDHELPGGTPHPRGGQFPPSCPASLVLTEIPLLLLQPLPVRGSAGANAGHGAASANIDRAGKATPGPALCSGLTVKSRPWASRGARRDRCQLRVGLTPAPGSAQPIPGCAGPR